MAMGSRVTLVIATVASWASCGGSSIAPAGAQITATLTPNPVTATVCSPAPCQGTGVGGARELFELDGTLTVQETAGIGGDVVSVGETALAPQLVMTSAEIVSALGTNHLLGHGMLSLPIHLEYEPMSNPNVAGQFVVPFTVLFTDAHGNQLTAVALWRTTG
jgi:hypothetical protein